MEDALAIAESLKQEAEAVKRAQWGAADESEPVWKEKPPPPTLEEIQAFCEQTNRGAN
jgi:hypothetical protein